MAKGSFVNVNGTWRKVKNVWTKQGGIWKQKTKPKVRVSSVWKDTIAYQDYLYVFNSNKTYTRFDNNLNIVETGYALVSELANRVADSVYDPVTKCIFLVDGSTTLYKFNTISKAVTKTTLLYPGRKVAMYGSQVIVGTGNPNTHIEKYNASTLTRVAFSTILNVTASFRVMQVVNSKIYIKFSIYDQLRILNADTLSTYSFKDSFFTTSYQEGMTAYNNYVYRLRDGYIDQYADNSLTTPVRSTASSNGGGSGHRWLFTSDNGDVVGYVDGNRFKKLEVYTGSLTSRYAVDPTFSLYFGVIQKDILYTSFGTSIIKTLLSNGTSTQSVSTGQGSAIESICGGEKD